ncbi:ATP-dependent helicase [uncultured Acetatifactor sp.]|uniref:ATP-dependent helicase n=1 Tax=uncultured Acetatifactor sp. TaxID=1671927 RepID=UPI00262786EC|nr:UvrD-helicase domain-containing protein [uncultured Acetatifactor sp.]
MADFMENLNERQREAVLETEGYVRVIAGAGSGKTKLLVSRYAYLVQDYGIDSSNILCVTFTNKAAGEMKKRIRGLIGEDNDVSLICTYHGFCNRLLRENPEKLFLNKQFQIIDGAQQKAILSDIYQKMELKLDYATFEAILKKIGHVKKDMQYVPKMCNPRPCQIVNEIKKQDDRIIEEFLQRQKATYSLDFHDLIAFATYLLVTDEEVREKWQERLNYIMVDEFQDSSSVEMRLVEILSGLYRNLMIVGDPDQNIYEWRGSDVKLLVDFDKAHEPTKTIILNQNYRSTPQILQCANTLIEKNELRLKKDLFTRNPAGAPVIHYHSKDDFEEMDQVVANIKKLQAKEGFRYSDFAIIYRASFLSRIAEKKLAEKNIPYEIFGGVRFYQRMEILDILAYLKLIAFDDDTAFRRIVNTPRRRFGRAKMNLLERLREQEREAYGETSLFEVLAGHLEDREFQGSDMGEFVRFIQSMRRSYRERRISDIVNAVTAESGYEGYIRELGDEERLDNLAEFKQIANEFEREFGENLSLEGFLQQIALQSGEDSEEARDAVKLMTIHSSKGLEFPVVFILGFTEGVFPSAKTMGDRKKLGLEEERRLCYVAITRAEKYLFLMESEGTSSNGMKKLISRFLEEIGEKNYVRIGRISEELQRESKGYAAKLNRELQTESTEGKAVGDVVEHHAFGKGTIVSIDERRGSYSIQFEKLQHPRNISAGYFKKEHGSARPAPEEGKRESRGEMPQNSEVEKAEENEEVPAARSSAITAEPELPEEEPDSWDGREFDESPDIEEPDSPDGRDESENWAEEFPESEISKPEEPGQNRNTKPRADSPNLWKRDDVPHSGWHCVDVIDLGEPVGICQMCGYQIIRYAHQMEHPDYGHLSVGCVCAGRMEGDVEAAKRRESEFKNKQARRLRFSQRKWKQSKKGNEYLKIEDHVVVLYRHSKNQWGVQNGSQNLQSGKTQESGYVWKYAIDNAFCKTAYPTRERAVAGAFDALEKLRKK